MDSSMVTAIHLQSRDSVTTAFFPPPAPTTFYSCFPCNHTMIAGETCLRNHEARNLSSYHILSGSLAYNWPLAHAAQTLCLHPTSHLVRPSKSPLFLLPFQHPSTLAFHVLQAIITPPVQVLTNFLLLACLPAAVFWCIIPLCHRDTQSYILNYLFTTGFLLLSSLLHHVNLCITHCTNFF